MSLVTDAMGVTSPASRSKITSAPRVHHQCGGGTQVRAGRFAFGSVSPDSQSQQEHDIASAIPAVRVNPCPVCPRSPLI